MPVLMSPDIAAKFTQKWLEVYPEDQGCGGGGGSVHLDDSLTSLHWLQNFSILGAEPDRAIGAAGFPSSQHHLQYLRRLGFPPGGADSPSSPPAGDTASAGMPPYPGSPVTSGSDTSNYAQAGHGYPGVVSVQNQPPVEVDYKTNPKVKPPYSYASLICMAMQASNQPKVTLSTIYTWITDNFCYYRHAEPSWQNSIRHNLSLNKCFMKVPRQKDEPGKGGFWQIDPQYADMFVDGVFKRRRASASHYGHGHGKALQGHHAAQSGCRYQGRGVGVRPGGKRKHPSAKNNGKAAQTPKSPLLATEAHGANILRGDFDLASVFDDVLGGSCSNFEDLDINIALSSLGCEVEVAAQGRQHAAGMARWCGDGDLQDQGQHANQHQPYVGYVDLNNSPVGCHVSTADLHAAPHQLLQHQHPLHQFEEPGSLFPEQPEEAILHPWEEIKEEVQAMPLSLDQGFGLCDGFFVELQPWERMEAYCDL